MSPLVLALFWVGEYFLVLFIFFSNCLQLFVVKNPEIRLGGVLEMFSILKGLLTLSLLQPTTLSAWIVHVFKGS